MCFTGGYALAMATDQRMLAPVLAEPSMPLTLTRRQRHNIDTSPADLAIVKQRCAAEGLKVLGLRFKSDRLVSDDRFEFLREQLGDAFVAVELEDEAANPDAAMGAALSPDRTLSSTNRGSPHGPLWTRSWTCSGSVCSTRPPERSHHARLADGVGSTQLTKLMPSDAAFSAA